MVREMRPEILFPLFAPVTTLKGVGPRIAPLLQKLAGPIVRDVLFLKPHSVIRRQHGQIAHALESCQDLIKQVAGPKLTAPQDEAKSAAGNGQKDGKSAPVEGETKEEPGVGPLRTRQDAFELLKQVVAFFQRTEPQSLVPYALEQVIKWGTMSVPELLTEVIPEEAPRKGLFRLMGIDTVNYGPSGAHAHGANEYVEIPSLETQLKVLMTGLLDLLADSIRQRANTPAVQLPS